jgi:hypothetical protein
MSGSDHPNKKKPVDAGNQKPQDEPGLGGAAASGQKTIPGSPHSENHDLKTDEASGPYLYPKPKARPEGSGRKPEADPIVDLFRAVYQNQKKDGADSQESIGFASKGGLLDGLLEVSSAKKIALGIGALLLIGAFVFGVSKLLFTLENQKAPVPVESASDYKPESPAPTATRTVMPPTRPSFSQPPSFHRSKPVTTIRPAPQAEPAERVDDAPSFIPKDEVPDLNDDINRNEPQPTQSDPPQDAPLDSSIPTPDEINSDIDAQTPDDLAGEEPGFGDPGNPLGNPGGNSGGNPTGFPADGSGRPILPDEQIIDAPSH